MLARSHGYSGVILGGIAGMRKDACELTLLARRRMMEAGLTLGVEAEIGGEAEHTEYADICVLTYDKMHLSNPPSLENGERAEIRRHSENYEVSGAMLDLPAFALFRGGYISREDAIVVADRRGGRFEHSEEGGYMRLVRGRWEARCENMENTRSRISLASECGMLGISFDLARIPFADIYMAAAMLHRPANLPVSESPTLNCQGKKNAEIGS